MNEIEINQWRNHIEYDLWIRTFWKQYFGEVLDWRYFKALLIKESSLNPKATGKPCKVVIKIPNSKKKYIFEQAEGLAQIMPYVKRMYEQRIGKFFNSFDSYDAIELGMIILYKLFSLQVKVSRTNFERFELALACYNAGIGNIRNAQRLAAKEGCVANKGYASYWQDVKKVLYRITGEEKAKETIDYVDFISELGEAM